MSKELLLLEELCKGLGFSVEFEDEQSIPGGQVLKPAKYNLTARTSVILPVDGDVWTSIVGYVLAHKDDIDHSINDFGDLMPVLNYFHRNNEDT